MWKHRMRKPVLGIRNKIILMIYLILFPVLIVTSSIIFYGDYTTTLKEAVKQYDSVIQSIGGSIEFIERDVKDISTYFSINAEVYDLLVDPSASLAKNSLFWTKQAPMDIMKDIFAIKSHMRTMILYPENGLLPFYVSRDASVHDMDIANIRRLPIYERAIEARGSSVCGRINAGEMGLFTKNRTDKIVFSRELFDLSKKHRLGFLAITIDVSWYEQICRNALLHDNESVLILNPDGTEVARAGIISDEVAEHIKTGDYAHSGKYDLPYYGDLFVFSSEYPAVGKTIYYLSPISNWSSRVESGMVLPIVLALALIVFLWPFSILASRIISKPLYTLYESMNKFKGGDFQQQVKVQGSDEIAELAIAFNSMVTDLRDLIDRNYVITLRERESELDALQAQINPHFLYNALDSLYWQATDSGHEKLAEDILSISELFRLLLNSGVSEVCVQQELHIIRHYLHIQKMRFSKKIDYDIEVDPRLLELPIPKLILQPFVENAIVHGLERKDTWGFVKVTGSLEKDRMVFVIEDSGTGMSREKLDEILSDDTEKKYANQRIGHYAIRNVKERMALKYGKEAMLEIESELGIGSIVRISLPLNPLGSESDEQART